MVLPDFFMCSTFKMIQSTFKMLLLTILQSGILLKHLAPALDLSVGPAPLVGGWGSSSWGGCRGSSGGGGSWCSSSNWRLGPVLGGGPVVSDRGCGGAAHELAGDGGGRGGAHGLGGPVSDLGGLEGRGHWHWLLVPLLLVLGGRLVGDGRLLLLLSLQADIPHTMYKETQENQTKF